MNHRKGSEFLRSHVLGLVAIFIALTGTAVNAGAAEETATSSAVNGKKFKKLKKRVGAIESKLNGSATGDLQGTYPNLQVRANAIGTAEIANDAVTRIKIVNDAVNRDKIAFDAIDDSRLAANSVGAAELKSVGQPQSPLLNIPIGMENVQTVSCAGGEQVLGGGALWDAVDPDLRMFNSFPSSGTSWSVNVSNQDGVAHGVRAVATCLAP